MARAHPSGHMPSTLHVREAVSLPSAAVNEDGFALLDDQLWVLDGASGLADTPITATPSDAAWLVENALAALGRSSPGDLRSGVRDMLDRSTAIIEASVGDRTVAPHEVPSASLAAVRLDGAVLEVLTLGDCRVVLRPRPGGQVMVTDARALDRLDREVIDRIVEIQRDTGTSLVDARRQVIHRLRRNRDLLNRPGGYHALAPGLDLGAIGVSRVGVEGGACGLVVSDGFFRLVETFHRYDPAGLIDAALAGGLRALLEELRSIERADPDGRLFPRLKQSDDATAVLFEVVGRDDGPHP